MFSDIFKIQIKIFKQRRLEMDIPFYEIINLLP